MKYGICTFLDKSARIVKVLDSDETHIKVEYGFDQWPPCNTIAWVPASFVQILQTLL